MWKKNILYYGNVQLIIYIKIFLDTYEKRLFFAFEG